jgi:hypothetical protein
MIKHTPATPLPWHVTEDYGIGVRVEGRSIVRPPAARIANGDKSPQDASYIAHTANAYPELVERAKEFREWYADHFEDFTPEVNAQLLCMDNDNAALLRSLGEE